MHDFMSNLARELRIAAGLALTAAGVWLFWLGARASGSFASGVARLFSGSPTKETVLLSAGGVALAVLGLVVALAPAGKRRRR